MPEGDTVWRSAFHLHEALAHTILTASDFRVPKFATVDLAGQEVDEVASIGKHLLIRTATHTVHSHLKMEGSWHLYRANTPRWRRPAHSARAVLTTSTWQAVGFSLGTLNVLARQDEFRHVGHLGPDPLSPSYDVAEVLHRLKNQQDRPIFLALHDQRNIAGFGNEYVNELLFLRQIAPTRRLGDVADTEMVLDTGHRLIHANAHQAQRSFTRSTRRFETHWVFGRDGQPCRRCGTTIERSRLGDAPTRERNTFWCPQCQGA